MSRKVDHLFNFVRLENSAPNAISIITPIEQQTPGLQHQNDASILCKEGCFRKEQSSDIIVVYRPT
jgi:hypothetical protein